ncbi:MAG: hypothetical protein H0Z38_02785 [Firmicutes bacterium]|nr:hypothetical protein [Bacillota bacterium]
MLLVISNGHGEDLMAARLIKKILELAPEICIQALPVVGEGKPIVETGVPVIHPGKSFPSGGFVRSGLSYLIADLKAGFWRHWRGQAKALRKAAPHVKLTLAVGDSTLLYLSRRHLGKPLVFVPTAKSDYIRPHYAFEIRWMKKTARVVFPRDAVTARSLARHGVNAHFVGNLMMDSIDIHGYDLGLAGYGASRGLPPVIGILPGSRDEAYDNFRLLAAEAAAYSHRYGPAAFPTALAGNINEHLLGRELAAAGWQPLEERAQGVKAAYQKGEARILLCKGAFGDVLNLSDLILGLAGTANEQAAGLGKPVVTHIGLGSQFTSKFVAAQKRLLGDAVSLVQGEDPEKPPAPEVVAEELHRILSDSQLRERMAKAGRERMGGPGGVQAVAKATIQLYREL